MNKFPFCLLLFNENVDFEASPFRKIVQNTLQRLPANGRIVYDDASHSYRCQESLAALGGQFENSCLFFK